ncbi:MAG: YdiU family protein [Bacteriovoracaceae bacterium]|nr:YdiU family protein [Bacteriovoracaceae bacterium]
MFTNSFADTFSTPALFTPTLPTPVSEPKLIAWSKEVAADLQIEPTDEWIQTLAGNLVMEGMKPIATRYAGHQFGHWAGQLGDGRAILLAEKNHLEIQLKGAGLTPYSRRGDGRAVLRSSVREFLCSEAMHFLGIPTTRALALVGTGDQVIRDMFYDGNAAPEPGAICTRVAESFIRFGHFQMLAADGNKEEFQKLLDYVLKFYPGMNAQEFFNELCTRTAKLMVDWMRVGFVHGVMNTDNMSILGLTIDYGPYGWLDVFDPNWTPNTTDREHRRYRFGNQPSIALWNLHQLAAAFKILDFDFSAELENFRIVFFAEWEKMMASKLGLEKVDMGFAQELDAILQLQETDMTIFYRELADCTQSGIPTEAFYQPATEKLNAWIEKWRALSPDRELMNKTNPYFLVRNYLAQEAIDGLAQNDTTRLNELMQALKTPYSENENTKKFFKKRPEWARTKAGCSALSCSS